MIAEMLFIFSIALRGVDMIFQLRWNVSWKGKQNNLCLSELASVKTDVLYAGGVDTGI